MTNLISKRNNVYLKDGLVYKVCLNSDMAIAEGETLSLLKKASVAVPSVLDIKDNTLVLEYIDGMTIPDFLEREESLGRVEKVSRDIVAWFFSYYKAVEARHISEIRGDVNGRNFIITSNSVYGVDFEERVIGKKETDIGRFLAYIFTYTLPNTKVRDKLYRLLYVQFIELLNLDEQEVINARELELIQMELRRSNRQQTNLE